MAVGTVGAVGASAERTPGLASLRSATPAEFGVVGDGRADDTKAAQAFLDSCAERGIGIADFGRMVVRISGPLHARGVGVVFDTMSYGKPGDPGILVTGSGYTALTVTGAIVDFCATVYGGGDATVGPGGRIERDSRPAVTGIAFGDEKSSAAFLASVVRHARAYRLNGTGIRHRRCWDTTFLAVSVEQCGNATAYAFDVAGSPNDTCNETHWVRVQVESSVGRAIRVDPWTLACTFGQVHSERTQGIGDGAAWVLGGSCAMSSVRLSAVDGAAAGVQLISNQLTIVHLRAEDGIRVVIDASGGVINLHNPGGVLEPKRDQSGRINVIGGVISVLSMGAGWSIMGAAIGRLEAGYMPPGTHSLISGCDIKDLVPQPGASQGELVLSGCTASGAAATAEGRLRRLRLVGGTVFTRSAAAVGVPAGVEVADASSSISGAR